MEHKCVIGKINEICSVSDKFIKRRINEERLPILRNHIPLFYILPEDGTAMLFNEIATVWDISKSSLSDIILKYEKLGFIKKCSCNEDKRSVYISLVPEALKIKKELYKIEEEFLNLLLEGFTQEQRSIFENNIEKALKNLKKTP